jgi:hypothetical protein
MANPNFGTFTHPGTIADQASFDIDLRTHVVRVYNYMAAGLALSGMVAFGLFSSAELASLFFQVQAGRVVGLNMLGWIAIFAPLGLLMLTSFRAAQMSVTAVQAVYWAVTALMGVSLSLLLFRYTGASVARTFFVTAGAFGALSLWLHDQARPDGGRQVPVHGRDRPDPGQPRQHDLAVGHHELRHLGRRRPDLLGPNRLPHPEDRAAVYRGLGFGDGREGRHIRRAKPLYQLREPIPVPDDVPGPEALMY